jgi:HAD superfamily hydrolase (TIGR01490 family)
MKKLSVIAAFDFDHTMTKCDSLLPFLIEFAGIFQTILKLALLTPSFIKFFLGNLSRQEVKEKILTSFFKGLPVSILQQKGHAYAHKRLDDFVKSQALERLAWHQQQGHKCLLVSASLDFYLNPWAKSKGFDAVICSSLEVTSEQFVTGKLQGLNCWGPEKKRRLIEQFGPKESYQLYMYGDSRGDQELLDLADYPFYRIFNR